MKYTDAMHEDAAGALYAALEGKITDEESGVIAAKVLDAALARADVSSVATTHALCEVAAEYHWRLQSALRHLKDEGWKAKSFDDQRLVQYLDGTIIDADKRKTPTVEDIRMLEALRDGLRMTMKEKHRATYCLPREFVPMLLAALEKVVPS